MKNMETEGLCKAKRTDNGEWIKGYPVVINNICWMYTGKINTVNRFENHHGTAIYPEIKYLIDPETVCRCTGKKYMDGETAYEGDIFESYCQLNKLRMVLKYGTYQAYCPADRAYMDSVGFYAEAEGYPQMPIGDLKEYALKIGNIFDGVQGQLRSKPKVTREEAEFIESIMYSDWGR